MDSSMFSGPKSVAPEPLLSFDLDSLQIQSELRLKA
jgi:hypothetical protein